MVAWTNVPVDADNQHISIDPKLSLNDNKRERIRLSILDPSENDFSQSDL